MPMMAGGIYGLERENSPFGPREKAGELWFPTSLHQEVVWWYLGQFYMNSTNLIFHQYLEYNKNGCWTSDSIVGHANQVAPYLSNWSLPFKLVASTMHQIILVLLLMR